MRPLGFWVMLLACIVLAWIGESADAEDVFFFFPGDEDVNETHQFYIGEYQLRSCVILEENASDLRYRIHDSPLLYTVRERFYPYGTLNASNPWMLESGIGIAFENEAPAGRYVLQITLTYKNDAEELVIREFDYQIEYLQPLDVTDFILYRGITYRIDLEVETYIELDYINVSFDFPPLGDESRTVRMTDVGPDVYNFQVSFRGDMNGDIPENDYWCLINAKNGGHVIQLSTGDLNEQMEIVDEPESFLPVVFIIFILVIGSVMVGLYLSRNRNNIQDDRKEPPSN